jgi:hypothetical protein
MERMPTYSPVLINAASNGSDAGVDTGAVFGPFVYNNQLWTFQFNQTVPNSGRVGAWLSTDGGATWNEIDAGHALTPGKNGTPFFDGVSTVTFAWTAPGVAPFTLGLVQFNLATQKWGTLFATAGAPANAASVVCIYVRPATGERVILYRIASGVDSTLHFAVCSSLNVWTVPSTDLGTNMEALPGWIATFPAIANQAHSAMDTTGAIHVFWHTGGAGSNLGHVWANRCFYQSITPTNVLGSFFDFPGQDQVNQDLGAISGTPLGTPLIVPSGGGGKIVLPVSWQWNPGGTQTVPTVYVGAPINAPVWTKFSANGGVDPDSGFTNQNTKIYEIGNAFFDGTNLYWVFPRDDNAFNTGAQVRLIIQPASNPSATWGTASTILDVSLFPAPYNFANQEVFLPSITVTPDGQILIGGDAFTAANLLHEDRFWFGNFAAGPLPGPPLPANAGANPGPAYTISPASVGYAILPDPSVHCDVQGQKRCIIVRCPTIQRDKIPHVDTPMEN